MVARVFLELAKCKEFTGAVNRLARNKKSRFKGWFATHDKYERAKAKVKKALPKKGQVEGSLAYRMFGSTLLRAEFWSFDKENLARGLALGMFVAFTPTIGFQMILVCILILLYPGNMPVALAACWITNPFTAPPIYYVEYKIGVWIMSVTGFQATKYIDMGDIAQMDDIYEVAGSMWIGSLFVSILVAIASYWLMHGFLNVERQIKFEKIMHFRGSREVNGHDSEKKRDQ